MPTLQVKVPKPGQRGDGEREPSPAPGQRTPGASCQALRHAVSSLYRLDDFAKETLGTGFFSEVYKVTHRTTKQIMVLKMNTSLTNRPNMLREVQLMNRLSHPNILRFMGVCVHEGQLHALTEFINGGSLEELLADTGTDLSWNLRFTLAADVAKGIKYLHSRGIMHRDLTSKINQLDDHKHVELPCQIPELQTVNVKWRNVLIRKDEHNESQLSAVVGDFGLAAKIPDPLRGDKSLPIVGSPYWMAPECINGEAYNEKADVFSFGIILCEIIARVEADPDILPRTSNFGIDYVKFSGMADDCPVIFLHLTYNCLQIDPKKRPVFQEIVENLEEIKSRSQMATVLADITSLSIDADEVMNKTVLEKILDGKGHRRNHSDESISVTTDFPETRPRSGTGGGVISVTPLVVAEVMSKDDQFYTPHKGENPFLQKFKDANTKLVGSIRENWVSWFELPSPTWALTPPCTPTTEDAQWLRPLRPKPRKCQSLPGSPELRRKELNLELPRDEVNPLTSSTGAKRTFSVMTSIRKLEEEGTDDCFDAASEGSSSNDSALGPDIVRDLKGTKNPHRSLFSQRKYSMDSSPFNSCLDRHRARLDFAARRFRFEKPTSAYLDEDLNVRSCSSSESCMSLDDTSMLSPTSSYCSYNETDMEFSQGRTQFEMFELKMTSRVKFQELVQKWEAKQQQQQALKGKSPAIVEVRRDMRAACIHEYERVDDPQIDRKFQELRQKWVSKETSGAEGGRGRDSAGNRLRCPRSRSQDVMASSHKRH